jgi:hypothetical protein
MISANFYSFLNKGVLKTVKDYQLKDQHPAA